tara:strand:+ start:84 stop:221 length:138 start_codon:yes stop_codon:yes gene_type:complete
MNNKLFEAVLLAEKIKNKSLQKIVIESIIKKQRELDEKRQFPNFK